MKEEIAMNIKRKQTQDAFRKIKPKLDQTYPKGWFIALEGEQVIADAPNFDALTGILLKMSKNPAETFMVQAGIDYPEKAVIFELE